MPYTHYILKKAFRELLLLNITLENNILTEII